MAVLSLKILGGFEARRSSGEIAEIPIRKGQALLAFLALNPGEVVTRSKLAGLLWGDRGDTQARASLRQTLTVLRKALKPMQDDVLRADRQSIGLNGAGVEVDAVSFRDLIARGTPTDLETAVSLYRGDLLDGLDIPDRGFQGWLEGERRRFQALMIEALSALMAHKRANGAPHEGLALGQRLLSLEPFREDVHRALMSLYAELGQRHAGYQQYQRCRELLASELGVEPEAETEALYQVLRKSDKPDDAAAEVPGSTAVRLPKADTDWKRSLDSPSERPLAPVTGVSHGGRRSASAVGRMLMTGGLAALVWLLPWAPSFEQVVPDHVAFQRFDVPSLAVASLGSLSGVPEGATESSGPPPIHRTALSRPGEPLLAESPFDHLLGVLEGVDLHPPPDRVAFERLDVPSLVVSSFGNLSSPSEGVTESSGPASLDRVAFPLLERPSLAESPFDNLLGVLKGVSLHSTAQREADGHWPVLADSWNLRAVRAFKTRYPEATQVAEADRRIVFLIQRHREAQAELNRLGYDAGPEDGMWGSRSARAMRAFQADNGLKRDGVVSEALLSQLKTATPKVAAPADLTPEAEPQPVRAEPEVAVLSRTAEDGISEGSRWTAYGLSRDGSKISAVATQRGNALKVVFDIDHRPAKVMPSYANRYTRSCTDWVAGPVFECWIPSRIDVALGAKVFGTFPRLTYQVSMVGNSSYTLPPNIVLDFRPEPRLAGR